jgi:chemotaxis protein methyltransferase CheR
MQNEAITFFAHFIEKELGIIYSEFNYFQLNNRLEEITKMRGLKSVDELLNIARTNMPGDLKQLILDIATNNETSFFRDPKLFQSINTHLLNDLFQKKGSQPLKIWSAACSNGQEPYTIAMMLQEFGEKNALPVSFNIFASDISSRVLERAKAARFSQLEVQRGLPANLMLKYFDKDKEDYWSLKPILKDRVKFDKVNLLGSFDHLDTFDLIFCRNVLIYQNVENKKKIIDKIMARMTDKSFLILGAGESMIGLSEHFETTKIGDVLIYRLKSQTQKVAA